MENKVIVPLGEGFEEVRVCGVFNYDSCKDLETKEIEEFIHQEVKKRMEKFVDKNYPDKVQVEANYIIIDHFYNKKGELTLAYEYTIKNGLKRIQDEKEQGAAS